MINTRHNRMFPGVEAFVTAAVALLLLPLAAGCYASASKCGNGTCGQGETCSSCPRDCGSCTDICGDGACSGGETCGSCAADCGACGRCGDGICSGGETCGNCSHDCGSCMGCGDGICGGVETCGSCPADCGDCEWCGDGICGGGETCGSCSYDCGSCEWCGDGICGGGEDCSTCPSDCGYCPGWSSAAFSWSIHNVPGGSAVTYGRGTSGEVCQVIQNLFFPPSPLLVQLWVDTNGDNMADITFEYECFVGSGLTTEEWWPGHDLKYAFALVDREGALLSLSPAWESVILDSGVNDLGAVNFILGDYGPLGIELAWADKMADPDFGDCVFPPQTVDVMGYLLCYGDLVGGSCQPGNLYDLVNIDVAPLACRTILVWDIIDFGAYTLVLDGEDPTGATIWGSECRDLIVDSPELDSNSYTCYILMTAAP